MAYLAKYSREMIYKTVISLCNLLWEFAQSTSWLIPSIETHLIKILMPICNVNKRAYISPIDFYRLNEVQCQMYYHFMWVAKWCTARIFKYRKIYCSIYDAKMTMSSWSKCIDVYSQSETTPPRTPRSYYFAAFIKTLPLITFQTVGNPERLVLL